MIDAEGTLQYPQQETFPFSVKYIMDKLYAPADAASLAFFRIVFACIMLYSQIRFIANGWVYTLYIKPAFFFKYYGFYWVHTLPGNWMYLPWVAMIISLLFVLVGKYYRVAISTFFLLFSYTELLDISNYLNHYYLVTLLSFIMMFLPMHAGFSLDANNSKKTIIVRRWMILVLQLQVGLVYFLAGISKIKYDWLINAEPLRIWLGTCQNIPVIGKWLAMGIMAYIFSWAGMLFDLTAPFLLINKRTRKYEYAVIVVFHTITLWLFYIGIFPLVMMGVATIFFSPAFHRRMLEKYFSFLNKAKSFAGEGVPVSVFKKATLAFWSIYFIWQLAMPFRYLLYNGNVLWTEQGYRYSWNVMLMEKDGYADYTIKDKVTGEEYAEFPKKHLTPLQEKMMETQPDMILQYAHFLADLYRQKLHHPVAVYVSSYVALNGKPGQVYIDPKTDLSAEEDSFLPKPWILPQKI